MPTVEIYRKYKSLFKRAAHYLKHYHLKTSNRILNYVPDKMLVQDLMEAFRFLLMIKLACL
jgi:hypothetical protein